MSSNIKLGRLAGVEVGIHWSWLLVVALIVWSLSDAVFPEMSPGLSEGVYLAMAIVAVLLFFTSLLLHELGHARTALREGMEIEGITLWIFGGIAQFRGPFPSAGAEFRIAVAGPLVTLAIAASAIGLAAALPLPAAVDDVTLWLGEVNLILLLFNLVPALPLDGGRILRAALWQRRGDFLAATRTAASLGRGFGQLLIAVGVFWVIVGGTIAGVWFVFIGWFLLAAAEAEQSGAETHLALLDVSVRDAMVVDPVTVDESIDLGQFMDDYFFRRRFSTYPVIGPGGPAGLVSYRSVLEIPSEEWPKRRVGEVMTPLTTLPVLAADSSLESALERLAASDLNRTLVIDAGELVGLLSITDASRLVGARRAAAGRDRLPVAGAAAPAR